MIDSSDYALVLFAIATSMIIGIIMLKSIKAKKDIRENLVSTEVSEKSLEVANEVTMLRTGLQRIARSPDPIKALIEAMSGNRFNGRNN